MIKPFKITDCHANSTENNFIYVTTQNLSREQLSLLSDEVGSHRTLLVMCAAFRGKAADFSNLTIKKISNTVLSKYEWGHDDYSLQVENLASVPKPPKEQLSLFEEDADAEENE
jgi:adenine-specific DNA-methyltransferase